MEAAEYCAYDATGLAELVAKGEVTPPATCRSCAPSARVSGPR